MDRHLKIEAISWKTHKLLVDNNWIKLTNEVDLKKLEKGKAYDMVINQRLNGEWIIEEVFDNGQKITK